MTPLVIRLHDEAAPGISASSGSLGTVIAMLLPRERVEGHRLVTSPGTGTG